MHRLSDIDGAVTVDEIGIAIGHFGDYLLKSFYQPIFRREGDSLVPFAAEALVAPIAKGVARQPAEIFEPVETAPDRPFVDTLCRTLHLRNFEFVCAPRFDLFVNFDPRIVDGPAAAAFHAKSVADLLVEAAIEPANFVCEITEAEAAGDANLLCLVAQMRNIGVKIAIDDFGVGHSTLRRVHLVRPDIVKLDKRLVGGFAGHRALTRLLGSLVSGLHDFGCRVLAEGVETPEQLAIALEAGVDYVQGFLLARPQPAGEIVDFEARLIGALLAGDGNALPKRA